MSYLESLFTRFGTDKGTWGYTPFYEVAMEKRRFDVKKVLEIGICGFRDIPGNVVGASLFCWRDYFPNAEIYGIDNDQRFIFNDQKRIHTAWCDAYNRISLSAALESWGFPAFDMIVDDAVHDPLPQLQLARSLLPALSTGGRYFIEEACGYKLSVPYHEWMAAQLDPEIGVQHVACCVTHKPEELCVLIK